MNSPGWFSGEALRKRGAAVPEIEERAWASLGAFMAALLGPPPEPGPPYVHVFAPPEPIGQDEDGNDIYPEPGPALTLTRGPAGDVVAEAGFVPAPERAEITADFCQCPACREARCEP